MSEVRHQPGSHFDLNSGNGGQELADLSGARGVSGGEPIHVDGRIGLQHPLALQLLKMADGQFEDVGLFEAGDGLAFGLEGEDHQVAEVLEALVDAGSALPLDEGLHDLAVLVAAAHLNFHGGCGFPELEVCQTLKKALKAVVGCSPKSFQSENDFNESSALLFMWTAPMERAFESSCACARARSGARPAPTRTPVKKGQLQVVVSVG